MSGRPNNYKPQPAKRKRICTVPLRGTDAKTLKILRHRLKHNSGGLSYVYRESGASPEIVVANHDVPGRRDLIAVYDHHVSVAMLRQDLYGEDPEDMDQAHWGEGKVAA